MSIRPVKRLVKAKPTLEGAGVHLRRAFGFGATSDFDPFLLHDDSATTCRRITWRASRGILTAASRRSPMFWPERWSTAIAWGIAGPSRRATSTGRRRAGSSEPQLPGAKIDGEL